jgi:hypothetical protein
MDRDLQGNLSMSKGGTSTTAPTTTTGTSGPWSGQQPYLLQGFNQAQNLFNQGGQQYYPGQTYAGPTSAQLQGITNESNLGLTGTAAQNAANPALANILGANWLNANPANPTYANAAGGGMNVNTGGYYTPLATGQQTNTMGMPTISGIASGNISNTAGQPTLDMFSSGALTSANNPYFSQMAKTVAGQVLPQITAPMNAANRMDSGLASYAAGQGLGSAIGNLAYQNYNQQLQQQQQAATQLGYLGQGNLAAREQAAGMMSNVGQENIGNQMQAAGALTNLGFGNIGTQLTGAQGLGQNFTGAGNQQLSAIGQAPSIGNLDYQQAAAMQEAGGNLQQLNQQAITDAMNRWNFGQQQPYSNLQTYMQNIQGNYGNQATQQETNYVNPMANALSSGLGAYGIGNLLGRSSSSPQTYTGLSNMTTDPSTGLISGIPTLSGGGGSLFSQIGNWLGF